MKLLMISGDRSLAAGKAGAFSETLGELCKHFERIDILCPIPNPNPSPAHSTGSGQAGRGENQVRVIHDKVYIHPSPHGLWYQPFWILKKGKELFAVHHHEVATVHEYPPFYNGIGARLLKRRILRQDSGQVCIPAVLEIHHIVGWPNASSFSESIGGMLSKFFLASHTKKFEAVRVVNQAVQNVLVQWGVEQRKISIVPSVYLDQQLVAELRNTPKKFDLVFAARLTDNKGLLPVLRSLTFLPNATLLVIGDGSIRSQAEALARSLGVSSRVMFAGWLPAARNVLEGIASGKLFIMNSKSEGNPRVAIEAMALGVPVLATRVGIMPDAIVDGLNGVFTDGSAEDIAVKAQTLLSDNQKRASMGTEAMTIAGRFEKATAIKNYADFLKSLA